MIFTLDTVIKFGRKHRGETVREVLSENPQWLLWAHRNIEWFELEEAALNEAKQIVEKNKETRSGRRGSYLGGDSPLEDYPDGAGYHPADGYDPYDFW